MARRRRRNPNVNYERYLDMNYPDVDWLHLQEELGVIARWRSTALALGRGLFFKDLTAGLWVVHGAGSTIDDSDSYTTTGTNEGVKADDASFQAGKTYTMRLKGTTTSSGIQVLPFGGAGIYKTITGGGAFDETFSIAATADGLRIRNQTAGTTDFEWPNCTGKQTGILPSSAYANPGDNPMDADNTGMSIGNAGVANVEFVYLGDGATTGLEFATIAEINSKLNPDKLTMILDVLVDDWSAGTDVIWRLAADADNELVLERRGALLAWRYRAEGHTNEVTFDTSTLPGGSPSSPFTMAMTADTDGAGELIGYMSGIVRGSTTIDDEWLVNLVAAECAIFAGDNVQANSLDGGGAHVGLASRVFTPTEIIDYDQRSGL